MEIDEEKALHSTFPSAPEGPLSRHGLRVHLGKGIPPIASDAIVRESEKRRIRTTR
jgi:hypothetical protein